MAALDFPTSPTVGQTYTANGTTWRWDGVGWASENGITSGQVTTALGYTPVNPTSLATVATSGAYADLSGKPTNVSFFTNDAGYITSSALTGYLLSSTAASTYQPLDADLTAIAGLTGTSGLLRKTGANTWSLDTNTYLTSFTETDPVFSASPAAGITGTNISNWNTAYGWGNHASAGYLTGITSGQVTTALGYTPANRAGDTFTGAVQAPDFRAGTGSIFYLTGDQFLVRTTGGTQRLSIDGSGSVTANVDLRAPIFYDSANTAFYADPAGTSNFNFLNVAGDAVYKSAWTYGFQSGSDFPNGTLVATDIPANIENGDSFVIEIMGKSYSSSNPPFKVIAQGYIYANTIIAFSGISHAGDFAPYIKVFEDGGVLKFWWPTISYWNSFEVRVLAMNGPTNGNITHNRVTGITNSTEPTGSKKVQINLASFLRADVAAANTVDLRAPIFYDYNNTNYYIDAAGTSALNNVNVSQLRNTAGSAAMDFSSADYNLLRGADGAIRFYVGRTALPTYYDNDSHSFRTNGGATQQLSISGTGNVVASADMRAPLFYDSNNTAYYVDPANNSTSVYTDGLVVAGNQGFQSRVYASGARNRIWSFGNADAFGLSYFQGTAGIGSADTFGFHFGTATAAASELVIVYNSHTQAMGSLRAPLFYDSNNTAYYVDPASTGTSIDVAGDAYVRGGNVFVRANPSGSGIGLRLHHNGADTYFDFDGNLNFRSGDGTFFGSVNSDASIRTTIFYDSANTGYYIDPNSTSNLLGLTVGNTITGSVSGAAGRLTSSDTRTIAPNSHNAATITAGFTSWANNNTSPYADYLHFRSYADGSGGSDNLLMLRKDAFGFRIWQQSFGSASAYSSYRDVVLADSSGVSSVTGSFRAPIFYDSDNTAYYLDASTTGTSLNVAGSIVAAGNVTAYSDIRVKDHIETVDNALHKLASIRGVTYTRTDLDDKERRFAGVIAQEIEQVLPEAIFGDEHTKTVDYNATIALLIQAVKELNFEVQAMKACRT